MSRMRVCQHCREGFEAATTGRPPKFCSATCRKAAWEAEKLRQAVAVAKAQAVAAERRRVARLANRGNETPAASGNRGNETPPAPPVPPAPPQPVPPKRESVPPKRPSVPVVQPGTLRPPRPLLPPPPGRTRAEQLPLDD